MSHIADMSNIKWHTNGNATYAAKLSGFSVDNSATGILVRSVVVHLGSDDYKT